MKTKLLVLFLAVFAACGPNMRVAGAVAPAFAGQVPLPRMNADILGASVFLIANGYFWTVSDAQVLISMIETMPEKKKRDAAVVDLKKYIAMGEEKYKAPTLLGNRIAALFGVFSIFPHNVSDFSDWYFFSRDLPGLPESVDAFERISCFVEAKVIDSEDKKMIANPALDKVALRKALAMKKELDQYPFPFFFKTKALLPFSLRSAGKASLGAAAVGAAVAAYKNFDAMNAIVQEKRTVDLTFSQKRLLEQAEGFNGASIVLYRLRVGGDIVLEDNNRLVALQPAEIPTFEYPNPLAKRDLIISRYSDADSGVRNGVIIKALKPGQPLNEYSEGAVYYDEMEYWEPEQLKILVDLIAEDPTRLHAYGERLFGSSWVPEATKDGHNFEALMKLLVPSVDSGELSLAESASAWLDDLCSATQPLYRAAKDVLGLKKDPDANCAGIKRWAKFVQITEPVGLSTEWVHISTDDFTPAITYQELQVCVCEMLTEFSEDTSSLSAEVKGKLKSKQLSKELNFEQTASKLLGKNPPSCFCLKDHRSNFAREIEQLDPSKGVYLQLTKFADTPLEWIFGAIFGPRKENLCPSESENLQHEAIRVARAQGLFPFPFFAKLEVNVGNHGIDQASLAASGSSSDGAGVASIPAGAFIGGARVAGRRHISLLAQATRVPNLPDWAYMSPSSDPKDYLPAIFRISFNNEDPLGKWLNDTRSSKDLGGKGAVRLLFQYEGSDAPVTTWAWGKDSSNGEEKWVGPLEGEFNVSANSCQRDPFLGRDLELLIQECRVLKPEPVDSNLEQTNPNLYEMRRREYTHDKECYNRTNFIDIKKIVQQFRCSIEYCDFRLLSAGSLLFDHSFIAQTYNVVNGALVFSEEPDRVAQNKKLQKLASMRTGCWYNHPYLRKYTGGYVEQATSSAL